MNTAKVYEALDEHSPEVEILIPPPKNAYIWQHGNSKEKRLKRDENLRYIRSLAATIMFRLKTIFGDKLFAFSSY